MSELRSAKKEEDWRRRSYPYSFIAYQSATINLEINTLNSREKDAWRRRKERPAALRTVRRVSERECVAVYSFDMFSESGYNDTQRGEQAREYRAERETGVFPFWRRAAAAAWKITRLLPLLLLFTPLVADAASCVYKLRLGLLADNNIRWHTSRRAQKLFIAFPSVESAASMLLLARLAVATFYFIAVKIGKTRIASVVMPLIYTPTKKRRRRAKTSSPSQDITWAQHIYEDGVAFFRSDWIESINSFSFS